MKYTTLNKSELEVMSNILALSKSGIANPSKLVLAELTGMTTRNVRHVIKSLERKGYIQVMYCKGGHKKTNFYQLNDLIRQAYFN